MSKNIVICADGTGNTTTKGRGTNVFKLYEAVDQNGHRFDAAKVQQVAIYHDGVGTETLKWPRLIGGAFGWGLSRNVKQLYGELARVYDPGDRIYLFGFSRGAFTVRTLAGLVVTCGIIDPSRFTTNRNFWKAVRQAYNEYRKKYQTTVARLLRGRVTIDKNELRKRFSVAIPGFHDDTRKVIEFVGVWDTVDAVGSPLGIANIINGTIYRFKFPDTSLSSDVGFACHALALDEERKSFTPLMWREDPDDARRIEQVWFAGVHSNVGGGYPRQGLSLVALDWMMRKAETHGVRFQESQRLLYRDATDVDDKLYDSRAGFGVFYRWEPRNVEALCVANNAAPKVHRTVLQRIARNTEGYAPGSVPADSEIITTSSEAMAGTLRKLVADAHGSGGALLNRERGAHLAGVVAHWLLIGTCLVLAGFVVQMYYHDVRAAGDWRSQIARLAATLLSTNWFTLGARSVWQHPWLPIGALLAFWITLRVDRHLDGRYSEFWHRLRKPLRELLESSTTR